MTCERNLEVLMKDKKETGLGSYSTQYRLLIIGTGITGNTVIQNIKEQGIDGLKYLLLTSIRLVVLRKI